MDLRIDRLSPNTILSSSAKLLDRAAGQYVALAAVLILASTLRFYKLGAWSLWIDEFYTIGHAQNVGARSLLWRPLNLIITERMLDWLGSGEWALRLMPALIGVLSIAVLYFLVRRLFGRGVAFLTALFLAIAPWHLYWSQNARFYIYVLLFYNIGLFLTLIGIKEKKRTFLAAGVFFLFLAVREKTSALVFAPVIVAYVAGLRLLMPERAPHLRLRTFVILLIPVAVLLFYDIFAYSIGRNTLIGDVITRFAGRSNHSVARLAASAVWHFGLPHVCLGFVAGLQGVLERDHTKLFLWVGAVVPLMTLMALTPVAFTVDRYIFVSLPFWLILSAVGFKDLFESVAVDRRLLVVGLLLVFGAQQMGENWLYYTTRHGDRPQWREAFALVEQDLRAGDRIYSTRPNLGRYYLDVEISHISNFNPEPVSSGQRLWFVLDENTSYVPPRVEEWVRQNSRLVDALVVRLPAKSMDIFVYLHEPAE